MPRWIPGGPADEASMLAEIGLTSPDELFREIPKKVRLGRMGIGAGLDEMEVIRTTDKILDRNKPTDHDAVLPRGPRCDHFTERVLHVVHAVPA
jgi:glycine cleavage system pyridoxal-binding protein P